MEYPFFEVKIIFGCFFFINNSKKQFINNFRKPHQVLHKKVIKLIFSGFRKQNYHVKINNDVRSWTN